MSTWSRRSPRPRRRPLQLAMPALALRVVLSVLATGLLVPNVAHAVGVDPAQASPVQREQAQSRFRRGKHAFDNANFEMALEEFRASFEIVASPNTRLMVARCLREQKKFVAAYAELGRTAIEAQELERSDSRYGRAAKAAEAERKALESELGFVHLTVLHATDRTSLRVNREEIKKEAWTEPVPVLPGEVVLSLETPGYRPAEQTVSMQVGAHVEVTLDATANPDREADTVALSSSAQLEDSPQERDLRPYAYVAGGVGLAGLATFGVAGWMARSDFNELDDACGGRPCPPSKQDQVDAGRTKQTVANVGLVVGVLGLATGTTLFLLSSPEPKSAKKQVGVVVSPGWVGVRGVM